VKPDSQSEPKTRILHYEEQVYVCEGCAADARRVYLWRGRWRCLPCFKLAARAAGATPNLFSLDPAFGAEGWRSSIGVKPVGEHHLRPKSKGRAHTKGFSPQ
jgi:hypothetical protein